MRAWMVGVGLVLFASPVWADVLTDDPSAMEGRRQVAEDSAITGIEGQVSIGPVRPVERKGVPNRKPYQAKITVLDLAGREVAVVNSDTEGKFRVAVPPGTYILRPESLGKYPRSSEQRVEVHPNSVSHVDIGYDSGIR